MNCPFELFLELQKLIVICHDASRFFSKLNAKLLIVNVKESDDEIESPVGIGVSVTSHLKLQFERFRVAGLFISAIKF